MPSAGESRSGCPINATIEVIGDRWSLLVLRDVMFGNRRHFRELIAGSEEGIATNILASRLKQLVAAGLLTRDEARRGQRAAYSLTEAGIQVLPVMVALGNWGLAHRHGERRLQVRAELASAHELGTKAEGVAFGERVVDTRSATGLADHRVPKPGREHPLVQAFPGVTERGVERDAVAGPEPVQGDREVVDTDLGHGCLPSGG